MPERMTFGEAIAHLAFRDLGKEYAKNTLKDLLRVRAQVESYFSNPTV